MSELRETRALRLVVMVTLAAIATLLVLGASAPGLLPKAIAEEYVQTSSHQKTPGLVAEGEVDIMITEIMEAGYYVGQDERLAAPLIREPFTSNQLGALMPKGSDELLAYVDDFLAREKAGRRIDELADEYIYRYIEEELDMAA